MDEEEELRLVALAVAGRMDAMERLVAWLTPVIQVRAARALLAGSGGAHRNLREEVEDMTQEVFTTLLEHQGRVLRAWRPGAGLSLRNFVGMVARRRVGAIMSVRKRNPWYEEPVDDGAVERALPTTIDAEARVGAAQVVTEALRCTGAELSERGQAMLGWMIRDGLTSDEIRARTAMTDAAIYQWRSRISRSLRAHVERLMSEDGSTPRAPKETP